PEHVPGAIERAARLVAARARVVEELPRAGARGDQRLLALEAALGEVQHRCRLPELGLPRAHVLLPGALAELDLLLLAADVGLRDHGQDAHGEREPSPHGHLVSPTTSSSGSPSSSCSSARRVCAW